MKFKKVVLSGVCAAALVVGTVAGTMAYLTSTTDTVANTFTVGSVEITLDEADVNAYGENQGTRSAKGNEYKLIPGHTYVKDPIVHVQKGSEPCYVFVKITDPLTSIEADDSTIDDQMKANGWAEVSKSGNETVYGKATAVDALEAQQDVATFTQLVIDDNAAVSNLGDIVVVACAVQADGLSYDDAKTKVVWL